MKESKKTYECDLCCLPTDEVHRLCPDCHIEEGVEHVLNIQAEYFEAIYRGEKTFEVRRDDRGFQKGDFLHLRKLNNRDELANNIDPLHCKVLWVLTGGQHGIEPGYVVMSIRLLQQTEHKG